MEENKVVNLNKWRIEHDVVDDNLLFGIPILGNCYLELTAQNAMKARNMELTRQDVQLFQEVNGIIDPDTNNAGIIDLNTFIYLIDIFHEDTICMNDIYLELNKSIEKYNKILKPSLFQRIKNFFSSKIKHINNK